MKTSLRLCGCLVASLVVGPGCTDDGSTTGAGGSDDGPEPGVTFHRDVEPILQKSCLSCHVPDEIGGVSFIEYEDAAAMADRIAAYTEARIMPPFHAEETEECAPPHAWKNDPRLTNDDIALLRAWADAGAPKGDPADAPPPYEPQGSGLTSSDLEIVPSEPFEVSGDEDLFVCVVYDPKLDAPRWVDGIHLEADNRLVAHHALTYRATRAEILLASKGNERFDCFGAPPGELIHAWAPGGRPFSLPEGVALGLGPEHVLVTQMHYHPVQGSVETDASSLQLRYATQTPSYELRVKLVGNATKAGKGLLPGEYDDGTPRFLIPAHEPAHVEEMVVPVPTDAVDAPILFVATHMHLVGRDAKLSLERDAGSPVCLVQTPSWDFGWQNFYEYDAPIDALPKASVSDRFRVRCTYDNTEQNPFLAEALEQAGYSQPIDVPFGESTLSEMCLGAIGVLVPVAN